MNAALDARRGRVIDRDTAELLAIPWLYEYDIADWDDDGSYALEHALEYLRIHDPPEGIPQIQQVHMPPPFGDGWRLTPYDAGVVVTDDDLVEAIAAVLVGLDLHDPESVATYENVFQAARDEQRRRDAQKGKR